MAAEPTHCSLCTSAFSEALILTCSHDLCIPCAAQLVDKNSGCVICTVCSQMTMLEADAIDRLSVAAGTHGNTVHINAPCMDAANVAASNGVANAVPSACIGSLSPEQRWHVLPRKENTPPRHQNCITDTECKGGGPTCHANVMFPVCSINASYPSSPKMMDASRQFSKGAPLANVEPYSWDNTKQGYNGICACHAKLPVAFWCDECNRLMCSECAVMDNKHKSHRVLPVRMAAVHVQANIEGFMSSLRATADEIRLEKQKLDTAERQINSHVSTSQAKLRQAVFEAQEKLKFFEDNLSKEFDTTGQDACKTIHTLREGVEKRIARVNQEGEQLLLALETLNDVGVLHWYSEAEKTASDLRTFLPDQTSRLIPNVTFSSKPLVISCGENVVGEFSILNILRSDTVNSQANAYDLPKFSPAGGTGVPDLVENLAIAPEKQVEHAGSCAPVSTQQHYPTAASASHIQLNPDGSESTEFLSEIGDLSTARFGREPTYPSDTRGSQHPGSFLNGQVDGAASCEQMCAVPTMFSTGLQSRPSPALSLAQKNSYASPSLAGAVRSGVAQNAGSAAETSYASPSPACSVRSAVARSTGLACAASYASPSAGGAVQSGVSPPAASYASPGAGGFQQQVPSMQSSIAPSAGLNHVASYASPSAGGAVQSGVSPPAASYASPGAAGFQQQVPSMQSSIAPSAGLNHVASYASPQAAGTLQSDVSQPAASYASSGPSHALQPDFSPTFREAINEDAGSASREYRMNTDNQIRGDTFQTPHMNSHYNSSAVELPLRPPHRAHEFPDRGVTTRPSNSVPAYDSRHQTHVPGTPSAYSPTPASHHHQPRFQGSARSVPMQASKSAMSSHFGGLRGPASSVSQAGTATGLKGGPHSMAPSQSATADARFRNVALCAGKSGISL